MIRFFYTHSFNGCIPKFIYSCFQNINWKNHNEAGGVPSLSKVIINKIEIKIPSPKEQQKIANCLTSLDQLITTHVQKLDTLKTHKKGLMQQLFPVEGKTVPNYRFPEFRDAGDWEEKTLSSVIDLQSGYAFQSKYFNERRGEKLLTPKNFTKNGYANFTESNTKYTNQESDPKISMHRG